MTEASTSTPRPLPVPFPVPFGAHPDQDGVTFTLFCRRAEKVWLLLFDQPDADQPTREIELNPEQHRVGDLWHMRVPDVGPGWFYLYRLAGAAGDPDQPAYNPDQWVLDPYAQAVAGSPRWGQPHHGIQPGSFPKHGAGFPKGVIVEDTFDWGDDAHPRTPLSDTIIYEAHVRGYTMHASSGVRHPGTYRGLIEKIPYLRELGITALELLPVQEFDEMEYLYEDRARAALRNFWGYSTVNFFAPNGRYAHDGVHGQQVVEFKELVRELHRHGIELILDIVLNHTAEGGGDGPVWSFRGIEPAVYYQIEPDGVTYRNHSGCGNTLNTNHPVMQQFIQDCLRHWVLRYRVDGFRFDMASIFLRGLNGEVLPRPPVVEVITEDPVLGHTKLIAEAWDADGLYHVGSFPGLHWSEWNGRYRDDLRHFWRGGMGMLSAFATRLAGSGDLYDRPGQSPQKSVNFITAHDGFTLADLVSYNEKHNRANGEGNRDGENHNHSHNYGVEGATNDPAILALRKRQVRNLLACLMLSQGVPMLLAGDEFFRTQKGNNNGYCQDNDLSWVDWSLCERHADLLAFTKQLIAFRKAHPSLRRRSFLKGNLPESGGADITWIGIDGQEPAWDHAAAVGCLLNGGREFTGAEEDKDHLLLLFNGQDHPVTFHLPDPPEVPWQVRWSTEEQEPAPADEGTRMTIDGRSVCVLASPDPGTD